VTVAELQQQLQEGTRAREVIVEENLGLVYNRLAKFQKDSGGTVDHGLTDEDLVQEGCLALLRAAEKFDLSRGIRFSTYATTAVWHAMQRTVHDKSRLVRLPSAVYRKYHVVKRVANQFTLETGRTPTDDEISEQLLNAGLTREGLRWSSAPAIRNLLNAVERRPTSFDARTRFADREAIDMIGGAAPLSKPKPTPELMLAKELLHEDLVRIMAETLEPEEQQVVCMRCGFEDGQKHTFREISDYFGDTSWKNVNNIFVRGIRKLRKAMVGRRGYEQYFEGLDGSNGYAY
jgi:RNA polymerase sigma factor (sigma-70 family)